MHMASVAAGRANGAPLVLSRRRTSLPSAGAGTVRFSITTRRTGRILCLAPRDGSEWDGRLVDGDMTTLRRRIRQQVRAESDPEDDDEDGLLPEESTELELERRHHGSYVREAIGRLLVVLLGAGAVPLVLLLLSVELIRVLHSMLN